MTPAEKERRKQIKEALKSDERLLFIDSLPANPQDIHDLFEYLDDGRTCDNELTKTCLFIEDRQLPKETFVGWLKANGGHCDCEVLFNVEEAWDELMDPRWQRG